MIQYNARGEFNVLFGRYKYLNTSLITLRCSHLLTNTEIFNTDYKDIFEIAEEDDFIFLAPPSDCIFSDYGNKEYRHGFNDKEYTVLARHFRKLKYKALLVLGRTPLTVGLYEDMSIGECDKTYAVNIRNRFKSVTTHIMVSNW